MNAQTKGIVIALASTVAGGLFPAAVSALMAGASSMAAGLGVVALMNAIIGFIHINATADAPRTHQVARKVDTPVNRTSVSSGNIELQAAGTASPQLQPAKEPLSFPVMGWYALPEDVEELPPEVLTKKPAKNRA